MFWPLRFELTSQTQSCYHFEASFKYPHNYYSKLRALVSLFEEPILSFRTVTFTLFQRTLTSFHFELKISTSSHTYQNLQPTKFPFKICISNLLSNHHITAYDFHYVSHDVSWIS